MSGFSIRALKWLRTTATFIFRSHFIRVLVELVLCVTVLMELLLDKVADDIDPLISDILSCELMLDPSLVVISACSFDVNNSIPYHVLQWELF